jgi:hypothetical protein
MGARRRVWTIAYPSGSIYFVGLGRHIVIEGPVTAALIVGLRFTGLLAMHTWSAKRKESNTDYRPQVLHSGMSTIRIMFDRTLEQSNPLHHGSVYSFFFFFVSTWFAILAWTSSTGPPPPSAGLDLSTGFPGRRQGDEAKKAAKVLQHTHSFTHLGKATVGKGK